MKTKLFTILCAATLLLTGSIPGANAQSRRDKEQSYILDKPYEVKKLKSWEALAGELSIHRIVENLLRQ